jgi:hypothetical protein
MPLVTCPDCGSQISDAAPSCPKCGRPSALGRASPPLTPGPPGGEDAPRCPSCGSSHIAAGAKGVHLGKALAGGFLLGPIGLLGGAIGRKKVVLNCMACGTQWEPRARPRASASSGKRLLVLLGLFFVVIVIVALASSSSRERRSAATATAPAIPGAPSGPAPTAPVTVSVATFTAGNVVDKCDAYAITATPGVAAADQAWANSFADGLIGDKKGMARLTTSCSQFQTRPVLATCTVHITDHVDGDSGVELGKYEIDQVRQYFNPNTIKGRDARTTECPDMKGDWQVVDRNLDVAVHLVKKALLTVDGRRSSMDIEDCIAFLTQSPTGLKPSKGWSVTKRSGSKYVASYSFINGTLGENLATWEVDVSTKFVHYTNENAKNGSGSIPERSASRSVSRRFCGGCTPQARTRML